MNIQLHRKQIVIVGIAMILAVASFWVPLPRQSTASGSEPGSPNLIGRSAPVGAIAFAREPATIRRFPVGEQILQTMVYAEPTAKAENRPATESLPTTQFLDQRDLANGGSTRLGNVLVVPVKNPDQPSNR